MYHQPPIVICTGISIMTVSVYKNRLPPPQNIIEYRYR